MAFVLGRAAGASMIGALVLACPALGQSGGVEETRPPLPEFRPEAEPGLELPPVPAPAERDRLSAGVRVLVEAFELTGNTVFSDDELAAITAPYTGRAITTEELLELRDALTRHYVEAGSGRASARARAGSRSTFWRRPGIRPRSASPTIARPRSAASAAR